MARGDAWFRINTAILDSRLAQTMNVSDFKREFLNAVHGKPSALAAFVRPDPAKGRMPEKGWRVVRERIFKRDNYTCAYCQKRGGKLECDHVIPLSRGGSNKDRNLVTACKDCNRDKRNRTPEEWRADEEKEIRLVVDNTDLTLRNAG